jgi:hypothetical protein
MRVSVISMTGTSCGWAREQRGKGGLDLPGAARSLIQVVSVTVGDTLASPGVPSVDWRFGVGANVSQPSPPPATPWIGAEIPGARVRRGSPAAWRQRWGRVERAAVARDQRGQRGLGHGT